MKRALVIVSTLALGLLGGCTEQSGQSQAQGGGMPPPSVSVITLQPQVISQSVSLPGRITPSRQSQVRPQVDGIITQRLFEEGALVEQGQQLYQIDDARYKAQLNSAKADLKSTMANLKTMEAKAIRYKDLMARNAVSEQDYDDVIAQTEQARASISVAQAAVDLAKVNLEYTKVYAPISGQISRSFVTEGTLVTANQSQQLATITQLDPVYVDMQESGSDVMVMRSKMRENNAMTVSLHMNDASGMAYGENGTLKFSEVTVDETTGAVALRAVMPNPEGLLLPGMYVRATVNLGEASVLLVPQRATTRQPDGSLAVSVVNAENKVEPRILKGGVIYQDQYIATGGVQAGDRVIVTGYQKVQPGTQVNPQPWQAANAGTGK